MRLKFKHVYVHTCASSSIVLLFLRVEILIESGSEFMATHSKKYSAMTREFQW